MPTYAALIYVVACGAGAIAFLDIQITGCFEPRFCTSSSVPAQLCCAAQCAPKEHTFSVPPPHEDHCLLITTSSGDAVLADKHGCKGVGTASAQHHRSLLRLRCQPALPPAASRRSHPHSVGSRGLSVADTDIQPWNDRPGHLARPQTGTEFGPQHYHLSPMLCFAPGRHACWMSRGAQARRFASPWLSRTCMARP